MDKDQILRQEQRVYLQNKSYWNIYSYCSWCSITGIYPQISHACETTALLIAIHTCYKMWIIHIPIYEGHFKLVEYAYYFAPKLERSDINEFSSLYLWKSERIPQVPLLVLFKARSGSLSSRAIDVPLASWIAQSHEWFTVLLLVHLLFKRATEFCTKIR